MKIVIVGAMQDPATLSHSQLTELVTMQRTELFQRDQEVAKRDQEVAKRDDIINQLEAKLQQATADYAKLWIERFGKRSERYIADPNQLKMDFGDTDQAADAASGLEEAIEEAGTIPAHRRRKPKKKRDESLPAHLPRETFTVELRDADKQCDAHGEKELLPESMWDVREKLVYVPGTLKVEVRKYPKYACPGNPQCGIASPERPTGIVEGDRFDTSVAAQILTNKYAYHLPVYRQQDMFAGSGWTPSRSTMLNILTNCFFIFEPLLSYFKRQLLRDTIIASDDTGVKLLYPKVSPDFDLSDPKQKRIAEVFADAQAESKSSINAKMWAYRGVSVKLNVFDFTVSRHRDGPEEFFQGYSGTLLGDCWHGFERIVVDSAGQMLRAACNTHCRRKFDDATDYPADRNKWMDWYVQLYDINDREHGLSREAKLELRQSEAKPIWAAMRAELDSIDDRTVQVVLPKSNLRKALNYLRNHWDELTRYLADSDLPIDNNDCEQLMKQVAIGRKNWLFCGSLPGGERNAGFMTLCSSAHRNDLDVWAYVNDLLTRLLAGETDYEPMLPWNWAASHPKSIRTFRQEERRDRYDRKQTSRAERRAKSTRRAKLKNRQQ